MKFEESLRAGTYRLRMHQSSNYLHRIIIVKIEFDVSNKEDINFWLF